MTYVLKSKEEYYNKSHGPQQHHDSCEICGSYVACDHNSICRSCGGFSRASSNNKINAQAAQKREYAKSLGCTALTGTLKQKKWAEDIRANFLRNASQETKDICAAFSRTSYAVINKAKWWIENRDDSELESKIMKWNNRVEAEKKELNYD